MKISAIAIIGLAIPSLGGSGVNANLRNKKGGGTLIEVSSLTNEDQAQSHFDEEQKQKDKLSTKSLQTLKDSHYLLSEVEDELEEGFEDHWSTFLGNAGDDADVDEEIWNRVLIEESMSFSFSMSM